METQTFFYICAGFLVGCLFMALLGLGFEFLTAKDVCLSLSYKVEALAQGFFTLQQL